MTQRGLKILCVEDDETLQEVLVSNLEDVGFEVSAASNGKDAFDLTQKERFDAIVSDVRMPGGDGIAFLKELREASSTHPPVIFISGFSDLRNEAEAQAIGAFGLVSKPFRFDALIEKVEKAISQTPSTEN